MKIQFVDFPNGALCFEYAVYISDLGKLLIVSWEKNLVYVAFSDTAVQALDEAKKLFPKASFQKKENMVQKSVLEYLTSPNNSKKEKVFLVAVKNTPFQLAVLKALTKVPFGKTVTYSALAKKIGKPSAVRAAASAVARNPIAILLPCHRVVPSTGSIGRYHWGTQKKSRLLSWESLNV